MDLESIYILCKKKFQFYVVSSFKSEIIIEERNKILILIGMQSTRREVGGRKVQLEAQDPYLNMLETLKIIQF